MYIILIQPPILVSVYLTHKRAVSRILLVLTILSSDSGERKKNVSSLWLCTQLDNISMWYILYLVQDVRAVLYQIDVKRQLDPRPPVTACYL